MRLLVAAVATSLLSPCHSALIVAHKNTTNPYNFDERKTGCQSSALASIDHSYIENTMPAIEQAFSVGADVVEFDLRLTRDDQVVVFHDETLDCLTDGQGAIRDWTLPDLRKLHMAWGHSADGGKTFPWRVKGRLGISTLEDVLHRFPDKRLMLNPKDRSPAMAAAMLKVLQKFRRARGQDFYWGDTSVYVLIFQELKGFADFIPNQWVMADCLEAYHAVGWLGIYPKACEKKWLVIDARSPPWNLWGWPANFIEQAHRHGSKVWVFAVDDPHLARYLFLHSDAIMSTYVWRLFR